jgi:putative transcriptional regulator
MSEPSPEFSGEATGEAIGLTGKLLIATPAIEDSRFARSVILVCSHTEEHAMGIVLNKPMGDLRMQELLEQLGIDGAERAADRIVLNGGPVDRDRGFVVHTTDYCSEESTLAIGEGLGLTATKDILEAITSDHAPQSATLALGYAGWGAGQLEAELQENAWLVGVPDHDLIFSGNVMRKWEHALSMIGVTPDRLSSLSGEA